MYTQDMKRLQIMVDEEIDAHLERRSAQLGKSKAAIIREELRKQMPRETPLSADPLMRMVGSDEFETAPVDEVVYR